jgi:hypothetical protein
MGKTRGGTAAELIKRNDVTVDESIARLASEKLGDVVAIAEGNRWMIGMTSGMNQADFLVSRLFTDAVFSQDIRSIQLIINRIDGGLPKDTEVAHYRTEFGDCLNEIMAMPVEQRGQIVPEDTVMMSLCKSLYYIATEDIYWDPEKLRKKRPSDSQKKERDAALRIVLERTGGRKTLSAVSQEKEDVEIAPWIAELPEITS